MISIIASIGENRELGLNNKLLWHIPEDLKRFRKITSGHPVIMGRKTFESILAQLGKPLPNRLNIVVTKDINYQRSHAELVSASDFSKNGSRTKFGMTTGVVCSSLEEVIGFAKTKITNEIFIIGGGQIYAQAIKYTDKLYLTIVEGEYKADTFFPNYPEFKKQVFEQRGESGKYKYRFIELERG